MKKLTIQTALFILLDPFSKGCIRHVVKGAEITQFDPAVQLELANQELFFKRIQMCYKSFYLPVSTFSAAIVAQKDKAHNGMNHCGPCQ